MDVKDLTDEQLLAEQKKWRGKMVWDCDGRTTSHGSYSLDYWMDMEEECIKEMQSRGLM